VTETSPSRASGPTPEGFALTGRSAPIDPRFNAVRADLADIRLAGRVFAPHYAAPLACRVARATPLLDRPGGEAVVELSPGDAFEVLELAGGHAWGRAPGPGLVGYLDRHALGQP
jgi:hypothetical protein